MCRPRVAATGPGHRCSVSMDRPWCPGSVDCQGGYQQASHTVVPFFRTGGTTDNRPVRTRSDPGVIDLALLDQDLAPAWQQDAECVHHTGKVDFFPARGESVRDAKAVCAQCPVRDDCLEFALRLKVAHGVWGGMSERERRSLRRDRHRAALSDRPR